MTRHFTWPGKQNLNSGPMKTKCSETRSKRTWFGASASVTIGPGFLHKAGFAGFVIPHPPLANWVLRIGLPGHQRVKMSFAHEFAHFQTAPVLFVYMLVVFVLAYVKGRAGMWEILLLLAGGQAAWEILSEGLVVFKDSAAYSASYEGVPRFPRILFWTTAGIFTAAGWVVSLYG